MSVGLKLCEPDLGPYNCSKEEELVAKAFTRIRPVVVEDQPEAHTAWLVVDQQSFCLGSHHDTAQEASWMCWQLAKALMGARGRLNLFTRIRKGGP